MLFRSAKMNVTFSVVDELSPLGVVKVNGAKAKVGNGIGAKHTIIAKAGMNLVKIEATDKFGNKNVVVHSFYSARKFMPMEAKFGTGTLVEIGAERRPADSIPAMLQSLDRAQAGPTFPPEGLCLQWIRYGEPGCGRQKQLARQRPGHSDGKQAEIQPGDST